MPAPSADYMTAVRKAAALATSVCAVKRAEDETGLAGLVGSLPQRATDLVAPITSSRTGQHALLGAGIGAGLAGVRNLLTPGRRRRFFTDLLTGGLLGGAGGLAVRGVRAAIDNQSPTTPESLSAVYDASDRATDARRGLGLIGVRPDKSDDIATGLATGKTTAEQAKQQLSEVRPSAVEQLYHTPGAVADSAASGDIGHALNQADVVGLKNLNPFHGSAAGDLGTYTATTLAPAAAAPAAASCAQSRGRRKSL